MNNDKSKNRMLLVLMLLTGLLLGLLLAPTHETSKLTFTKLDQVQTLIERHYVDRIGGDTLSERLISAMLSELDPHSHYLSAAAMNREEEEMRGHFYGIGILLHALKDTTCVFQVIPDGPSAQSGLRTGDRILRVDSASALGLKTDEVVKMLRGPRGSKVKVIALRPGEETEREVVITRGSVDLPSLSCHTMLDAQTGYLRLDRFSETSASEFRNAIASLKRQGMKRLIFDLRDNGGGLLDAAIAIADELLPTHEPILYTQGEHQMRRDVHSTPGGCYAKGPLVVMVNEYSASCSEILAGTVQDNDRGLVVGRRTFGKGLIQKSFPLIDGSVLFLTTARYYTPSGRCIQRPYDRGNDEYYSDFLRQLLAEAVNDTTLLRPTDTTRYFTTSGRVVYAGGGILPDQPIRAHTDSLYAYYNELINSRTLDNYAFSYAVLHQDALRQRYPSEERFLASFQVTPAMMQQLVAEGESRGIKANPRTLARYGQELRNRVKGVIGQALFSTETLYRCTINNDREIREALQAFATYPL